MPLRLRLCISNFDGGRGMRYTRAKVRAYACVRTPCVRTCVLCIRTCVRTIRTCVRTTHTIVRIVRTHNTHDTHDRACCAYARAYARYARYARQKTEFHFLITEYQGGTPPHMKKYNKL